MPNETLLLEVAESFLEIVTRHTRVAEFCLLGFERFPPSPAELDEFKRHMSALRSLTNVVRGMADPTFFERLNDWLSEHRGTEIAKDVTALMISTIKKAGLMPILWDKAKECFGFTDEDVITGPDGQRRVLSSTLAERLGVSPEEIVTAANDMGVDISPLQGPPGLN